MTEVFSAVDGNEAVARIAYATNEFIALYPITPSSGMGEWADVWANEGRRNIYGTVPKIVEMQSEGGAAGAVHGALQTGSLSTTFTASQGLLLMIPNMYKIAGELSPMVLHVTARTLATHALSIFGDHSDVMSVRSTGFAMLSSASVQETMDMALIAQAATLESRIPFLHFFDGFRVSHEVQKVKIIPDETIAAMIDEELITAYRDRSLSPEHPSIRGTAQNPDVFFQARERSNPYYDACPQIVKKYMDRLAKLTGRRYRPFDYAGAPDAEDLIIIMGSGSVTASETALALQAAGRKVGVMTVRLYRPFDTASFFESMPLSVKRIAVLDRTKEPGAGGEPLFLDVVAAIYERGTSMPHIIGGRYGLSSKEFTPAMVKGVFDHLASAKPLPRFSVGINDDVSHLSIAYDTDWSIESPQVTRALFYGLGADGTVGANKNSIKIIAEETENYAQGYFVYDSKKSGAMTISHLRFGPKPIAAPYLISKANFVACHQPPFLDRFDMLSTLMPGGTFLLNSQHGPDQVWGHLPRKTQEDLLAKNIKLYVIDAFDVARKAGMGRHINTVMQVCFFAISGVLPREEAIAAIKKSIKKTYARKGDDVVARNLDAVDTTLAHLHEVPLAGKKIEAFAAAASLTAGADPFVRDVLGEIIAGRGDSLPVSAFSADGTFPTATSRWEKRNIATEIPVWAEDICTQCGKCAFICPHAAIRIKVYEGEKVLTQAPASFKTAAAREKEWKGLNFSVQVAPEDCTGCQICAEVCPAVSRTDKTKKALVMAQQEPLVTQEQKNWEFFLGIPELDRDKIDVSSVRQQQAQQPLFEFSGACTGCGETPYLKLLTQLFGDRLVVANATGCSSIYGGNLPTTPWTRDGSGRGPAWANSLFEDNAEFGLGIRLSLDKKTEMARELLSQLGANVGDELVSGILNADQSTEAGIRAQRQRVATLMEKLPSITDINARRLTPLAEMLVRKSVWTVGGDGWAYDIGFGGLDHVIASGHNVNILVMDTEVYSNTGGQASKATPCGAIARFAEGGKRLGKKDLGLMAMSYGHVYVASVAMGARDRQTLRTFIEAEAYPGPSLIIAYAHCIAHGINITKGLENQDAAVQAGRWQLYRYNPALNAEGKNPLQLDSKRPTMPVREYLARENRFRALTQTRPGDVEKLYDFAQKEVDMKWDFYEYLASRGSAAKES